MILLIPSLCVAYLMGAIPTGLIMGKLFGLDVRKHGSGNVGATNVTRVIGKLPGLMVLIVDIAKGVLPVTWLAAATASLGDPGVSQANLKILLGVVAVAGHIWNPLLQFKGGKGVATGGGVLLGLDWRVAIGTIAIWLIAAVWSRYVSVASIASAFSAPFLTAMLGLPTSWVLGGIVVSLSIIYRHRENILRLLRREEHRIGTPKA